MEYLEKYNFDKLRVNLPFHSSSVDRTIISVGEMIYFLLEVPIPPNFPRDK